MDPNLVKGHFFLGQALLETENYDEAIKHLRIGKVPILQQKLFQLNRSFSRRFGKRSKTQFWRCNCFTVEGC